MGSLSGVTWQHHPGTDSQNPAPGGGRSPSCICALHRNMTVEFLPCHSQENSNDQYLSSHAEECCGIIALHLEMKRVIPFISLLTLVLYTGLGQYQKRTLCCCEAAQCPASVGNIISSLFTGVGGGSCHQDDGVRESDNVTVVLLPSFPAGYCEEQDQTV